MESFETALALGLPKLLARNRVKFYDLSKPRPERRAERNEETTSESLLLDQSNNNASRSSSKTPRGGKEEWSPMPRARTAVSLALRSQSAPTTVMMLKKGGGPRSTSNAVGSGASLTGAAAAATTTVEEVETRPIKSIRPTLGTRPYTQFDLKRK